MPKKCVGFVFQALWIIGVGILLAFGFNQSLGNWFREEEVFGILTLCLLVVFLLFLFTSRNARRTKPLNYILVVVAANQIDVIVAFEAVHYRVIDVSFGSVSM